MEGVYLIHTREFYNSKQEIYKIGRSHDLDTRVKTYPKGSQTIFLLSCKNSISCEKQLIEIFKTKFKHANYYGNEYFEGSKEDMLKIMLEFVYKNLINDINEKNNNLIRNNILVVNDVVVNDAVVNDVVVSNVIVNNLDVNNVAITNVVVNDVAISDVAVNKNNYRTCPKCNYIFPFPSRLKNHFQISTHCKISNTEIDLFFNNLNNNTNNNTNNETIYKCVKCNNTYLNKYTLKKHQNVTKCGALIKNSETTKKLELLPSPISTHSVLIGNELNKILQEEDNNIQHIYPFGFEKLPNISKEEMKKILLSKEKGLIDIIILIYEQYENKNFYKLNVNNKDILFLTDKYTLNVYQENELNDILYKKCIYLSNYILLYCKDILTQTDLLFINNNSENISDILKEEIYNCVKKIIYMQLRTNSKNTKINIDKYINVLNNNPIIKQIALNNLIEVIDRYKKK